MSPPEVRRWLELSVRSATADVRASLLAEGLLLLGGRAAEERDGWYVTHLPEPPDVQSFLAVAERELRIMTGLADVEIRTAWKAHEEWAETWRRGLAPRRVTDRIVVRPSWSEAPELAEQDIEIVLDPGMAFGTAEHGTTRGCLRLLDGVVGQGERVLDVGAGSGILAIAAACLGAREVLAVESDPLAIETLQENVERNGVSDQVCVVEAAADAGWLVQHGPADGVVANIESGVLTPLLPGFAEALRPGGWLIISGILASEWPTMRAAAEDQGFTLTGEDADEEWRSGLFRSAS
jgi:ribosomal protein L11 methyltransferase